MISGVCAVLDVIGNEEWRPFCGELQPLHTEELQQAVLPEMGSTDLVKPTGEGRNEVGAVAIAGADGLITMYDIPGYGALLFQ